MLNHPCNLENHEVNCRTIQHISFIIYCYLTYVHFKVSQRSFISFHYLLPSKIYAFKYISVFLTYIIYPLHASAYLRS